MSGSRRWADAPVDVLIGIDDTDNLTSRGTGWLAQQLLGELQEKGLGVCAGATRHQLLKDPRIPYTSHNSSACVAWCTTPGVAAEGLEGIVGDYLASHSAAGSDPGLAVAVPTRLPPDDQRRLAELGWRAKTEVLPVPLAREVAAGVGVELSGHGGTEDGVLGALAAVGLHLSGADGFFLWMPGIRALPVRTTYSDLRAEVPIDAATDPEGIEPDLGDVVELGDWVRPVLLAHRAVLLLQSRADGGNWVVQPRAVVTRH